MELWLMEKSFDGFSHLIVLAISATIFFTAFLNIIYLMDKEKQFPANKKRNGIITSIYLFIFMIFFLIFGMKLCINYNEKYDKEVYQTYQETELKTVYIKDIVALVSSEEDRNNLLNGKGLAWVEILIRKKASL